MTICDKNEEFGQLFAGVENRLRRYVEAMVPMAGDVDDVMQETAISLMRKYDQYDPDLPFFNWACRFAQFAVKRHHSRARASRYQFSDAAIDAIASDYPRHQERLEERRKALSDCLNYLNDEDRRLVELRYFSNDTVDSLSPATDNDQIWIGSALGGSPSNSFRGGLDSIAVHRVILDEKNLQGRFNRVGEEPVVEEIISTTMPNQGPLLRDSVRVTFHEAMASHDRWPYSAESIPPPMASWSGRAFLLDQIPLKYDTAGIRDSWKAPVLVRMAADVTLPKGNHTLLMRSRGLARAWVDGELVTQSKPLTGAPHGEEPITPVSAPPAPGHRPVWHRCQEVLGSIEIKDTQPVRVVLDAMAGGKQFRAEPGELTLAIRLEGSEEFTVLRPVGLSHLALPLTDEAVERELREIEASITKLNDTTRRTAATNGDGYWEKRRQMANSTLTISLTKAAFQSPLAELALNAESSETLLETLFLRFVNRMPNPAEKEILLGRLEEGFADRIVPKDQVTLPEEPERLPQVTWWNHVRNEANTIQQEHAKRVRQGPPADPRLETQWRLCYEDVIWSIVNLPEFVWVP